MAETYTLNMLGMRETGRADPGETVLLPDSFAQGSGSTINGRRGTTGLSVSRVGMSYGNFQNAAAHGKQLLCKNASGQQRYYRVDAERSDPARGLIFLLPVT